MSNIKNAFLNDDDDCVPVMKNPPPAKKDIKQCKYCNREITWHQDAQGKWHAMDVKMSGKTHKDYCHSGEPKFEVGERIIAFWKSETIVYNVTMADKESLTYGICQPKNTHKRYSSKTFPFKVMEKVATKLDTIAEALYT